LIRGVIPSAGSSSDGYVRPADWPAMPATAANKIDILAAVYNTDGNFVAVSATATGGFTVNWGDGTAPQTYTSGATASYQYSYAASGLGALTSEGYKTAIISITPTTSNDITAFDLSVKNATIGLNTYCNPWLDIQVNTPSCTAAAFSSTLTCRSLTRVVIKAIGSVTALDNWFTNCASLRRVEFPIGSLASVTSLYQAFMNCASLWNVTFPAGSLTSANDWTQCFSGCSCLNGQNFPSGTLVNALHLDHIFDQCYSLTKIVFPSGSLTGSCNVNNAFAGCYSLRSVRFATGSCGGIFNTTSMFSGCQNLEEITNFAVPVSFSISTCSLSGPSLDAIYTALPSVSGQTVTRSNNRGAGSDNPPIAEAKGWTVV